MGLEGFGLVSLNEIGNGVIRIHQFFNSVGNIIRIRHCEDHGLRNVIADSFRSDRVAAYNS